MASRRSAVVRPVNTRIVPPPDRYRRSLRAAASPAHAWYAEDRDLIPSHTDTIARKLYEDGYSARGLYAKLTEDAALNPIPWRSATAPGAGYPLCFA